MERLTYRIDHLLLIHEVKDWNTDTVLLNEKGSQRIEKMKTDPVIAINDVYELPSTEKWIRYLLSCSGLLTQAKWIKAIRAGNYGTLLMVNVRNVNKYFQESNETQKGRMRQI